MESSPVVPLNALGLPTKGYFKATIQDRNDLISDSPFIDLVANTYITVREELPNGYRVIIISTPKTLINGLYNVDQNWEASGITVWYLDRPLGNDPSTYKDYKPSGGRITFDYYPSHKSYEATFELEAQLLDGKEKIKVEGAFKFEVVS
ncbi:hypothetical protein [Pseudomonas koreensis]|uniref:hypothetical protein n=1 Tax=Pseudomonas koreensis TaxID=198620 RepID=UPI003D98EA39